PPLIGCALRRTHIIAAIAARGRRRPCATRRDRYNLRESLNVASSYCASVARTRIRPRKSAPRVSAVGDCGGLPDGLPAGIVAAAGTGRETRGCDPAGTDVVVYPWRC